MITTVEYTDEEIIELGIPSDDEIELMLEELDNLKPICGTNSLTHVNNNGFCVCSHIGAVTVGCNTC